MALQEILRQVAQAGQGEADAISTATRAAAQAILSEAKAEVEQLATDIPPDTKRQAEQLERQELPTS